jgi:hypothetical protein
MLLISLIMGCPALDEPQMRRTKRAIFGCGDE